MSSLLKVNRLFTTDESMLKFLILVKLLSGSGPEWNFAGDCSDRRAEQYTLTDLLFLTHFDTAIRRAQTSNDGCAQDEVVMQVPIMYLQAVKLHDEGFYFSAMLYYPYPHPTQGIFTEQTRLK